MSLPTSPLRLLPTEATFVGWDSHPLEFRAFSRRTELFGLKALRVFEPRLQSIEDNSSSGSPMIWGDIGWSELVPLSVMGEGMTQIARLVLGIASVPDGVVLVDELENGIHHTVLPDVWRVIDEAAKQFQTQIFATTHSLECVIAAQDSLSENRFRLHRLEIADKTSSCITYEPDAIDSAIRHNLEVR